MSVSRVLHRAYLRISANQSIPTGVATDVLWTVEDYDTDAYHDLVTNPARLTVPPLLTGWYFYEASISFDMAAADVSYRTLIVWKNAATIVNTIQRIAQGNGTSITLMVSGMVYLAVSDYLTVQVVHAEPGVARNVRVSNPSTHFALFRLGSG